ncbi:MAG: hypothetical protein HXY34_13360 [Candidatus Thorarchaeota archaeon]|nr:hypothetical protein [Candidatus Thorarchaeota archaeon]
MVFVDIDLPEGLAGDVGLGSYHVTFYKCDGWYYRGFYEYTTAYPLTYPRLNAWFSARTIYARLVA